MASERIERERQRVQEELDSSRRELETARGQIEDDQVAHFQVGLKVGFRLEDS